MWFETLTGFKEQNSHQVRDNLTVSNGVLKSRVNKAEYVCGRLEVPTLKQLRQRGAENELKRGRISLKELVADVRHLHANQENTNALFQIASQFNLLEMTGPEVTPEEGVDIYEYDHTQGPVCAIAAGAGTIYRNYFVNVNGQVGQSEHNQVDCLAEMGEALGNHESNLWGMKNGYALLTEKGLQEINSQIDSLSEQQVDDLRGMLRIGVQWDTQVTLPGADHLLTQAYCAALPVSYSRHPQYPREAWSGLAKIILEASYEATICAGILNLERTGNNKVYLTLVGGGAFGNDISWILDAIQKSMLRYRYYPLDVRVVSYGRSKSEVQQLIQKLNAAVEMESTKEWKHQRRKKIGSL
jgi:hypothetical protein